MQFFLPMSAPMSAATASAAAFGRDSFRQLPIQQTLPNANVASGPVAGNNRALQAEENGFVVVSGGGGGDRSSSTPQTLTLSARLTHRLQSISPCARRIALALSHGSRVAPPAVDNDPNADGDGQREHLRQATMAQSAHFQSFHQLSSSGFGRSRSSSPAEHAALEAVRAQIARAFLPAAVLQPQLPVQPPQQIVYQPQLCTEQGVAQLVPVPNDVPVERASLNRVYAYVESDTGTGRAVARDEHISRARISTPSLPSPSSVSLSPNRQTYSFTSSSSSSRSPSASGSASATASRASSKGRESDQQPTISASDGGRGLQQSLLQPQPQVGGCTPHSMRSIRSSLKSLLLEPARRHLLAIGGQCVAANALSNDVNECEPYRLQQAIEQTEPEEKQQQQTPSSACWRPREFVHSPPFESVDQQLMRPLATHSNTSCCPFPITVFPLQNGFGAASHLLREDSHEYCPVGTSWNCFESNRTAADLFDEKITSAEYLLPEDGDGDFDGASGESLRGSYRESALLGPSETERSPSPWARALLPIPPNASTSSHWPTSSIAQTQTRRSSVEEQEEPYYCRPLSLIATENAPSSLGRRSQQTNSGQLSDCDRCTSCSATSWSFTPFPPPRTSSCRPPRPPPPAASSLTRDPFVPREATAYVTCPNTNNSAYTPLQYEYHNALCEAPWRLAGDVSATRTQPALAEVLEREAARALLPEVPRAQVAPFELQHSFRADDSRGNGDVARVPTGAQVPVPSSASLAVPIPIRVALQQLQQNSGSGSASLSCSGFQAFQFDPVALRTATADAPIASIENCYGLRLTHYANPNPNSNPGAILSATPVYHLKGPALPQPQHYHQQQLSLETQSLAQAAVGECERTVATAGVAPMWFDAVRVLCEALTRHYDRELRAAHTAAVRIAEPLHQKLALLLAHNLHCIRCAFP